MARRIIGAGLCLIGAVWIGQGVGWIGGSFMSGQATWAVIGAVAVLLGLAMFRPPKPSNRSG
jgi:hypothetical protein